MDHQAIELRARQIAGENGLAAARRQARVEAFHEEEYRREQAAFRRASDFHHRHGGEPLRDARGLFLYPDLAVSDGVRLFREPPEAGTQEWYERRAAYLGAEIGGRQRAWDDYHREVAEHEKMRHLSPANVRPLHPDAIPSLEREAAAIGKLKAELAEVKGKLPPPERESSREQMLGHDAAISAAAEQNFARLLGIKSGLVTKLDSEA